MTGVQTCALPICLFVEGMSELGYIEGDNNLIIEFDINESNVPNYIADKVIEDLNELFVGYDITIHKNVKSFSDMLNNMSSGTFDIGYIGWGSSYVWPTEFLDLYNSSSSVNFPGYYNQDFDNLISKVGKSNDQVWQDLIEAEKMLIEDATIIPIYQSAFYSRQGIDVKNVYFGSLSYELTLKWAYKE